MECSRPTFIHAQVFQEFGWREHTGIDYLIRVGTPVYSIMDGVAVEVVQDSAVYGRYVLIEHCDGFVSLYAHLAGTTIGRGQKVVSGQLIGWSGGAVGLDGAGASRGWHLHLEVRTSGDWGSDRIDPEKYLEFCVRRTLRR